LVIPLTYRIIHRIKNVSVEKSKKGPKILGVQEISGVPPSVLGSYGVFLRNRFQGPQKNPVPIEETGFKQRLTVLIFF
jgi:hypothetical protein